MNIKQNNKRASKIIKQKLALRKQLWGEIPEEYVWNRQSSVGYTTIPRTLPIIFQIMDNLADKAKPVSGTYFNLWCRVFDASFVELKSQEEMAYESGFTGQRAVTTWKSRMKKLTELEFISPSAGAAGDYNYVLIINPYTMIKKFYNEQKIQPALYNALYARTLEVGATDLD